MSVRRNAVRDDDARARSTPLPEPTEENTDI